MVEAISKNDLFIYACKSSWMKLSILVSVLIMLAIPLSLYGTPEDLSISFYHFFEANHPLTATTKFLSGILGVGLTGIGLILLFLKSASTAVHNNLKGMWNGKAPGSSKTHSVKNLF